MKLSSTIILTAALAGGIAVAADNSGSSGGMGGMPGTTGMEGMAGMMSMMNNMRTMDTNGDQLVSRDEFMKSHERMFDAFEKNKEGLVAVKDMPCM